MKEPRPGPNVRCWCASGLKYKKCHYARDAQERDNPWDATEINKKAFQLKKCSAAGGALGPCGGKVILAHTVSRCPNLTKIAENSHVIHYEGHLSALIKNNGKLVPALIGISKASAFTGFCADHDQKLFSCIENEKFVGRPDQCLAVAYRTLSRELYGKNASGHLQETLRGADKGMPLPGQLALQNTLQTINQGIEASQKELLNTHNKLTAALSSNTPDALASVVLACDGPLPFMLAGAWSPFTDLLGKEIQAGYNDELLEQVFLSTFAGDGNSYMCISWVAKNGAPGQVIADQLMALPVETQVEAFLQLAVKHVENVFFSPQWFADLTANQRWQLNLLAASGLDAMGSVPNAAIRTGLDFELPHVVQHRRVCGH